MRQLLFLLLAPAAFAQVDPFANLDTNKDGKLSASELPKEARPFLSMVDGNADGFVTREEFQQVAANFLTPPPSQAPDASGLKNLDYAGNGNVRQTLDVYLPESPSNKKVPLVIYIHGGGWMSGDKSHGRSIAELITSTGDYAAASINYRLSQHALWPAQIHDCKAAVRYLRANAEKYGIDPERIAVMGHSAGGHLAAMLGTTNKERSLEGKVGPYPSQSSEVQCVVNFFGPTDFETFFGKDIDLAKLSRENMAIRLLGQNEEEIRKNARLASPIHWISKDDAPVFTSHGTADRLVPFAQAEELDAALKEAGVESHLVAMQGAGHGFSSDELNQRIKSFLDLHLRQIPGKISDAPISAR
ncbi:alpha/beta hydrolase fold domain-containing protein [Haloferula chungangensis]|uniref:Alpha/beta hydrolase fold domain-containing protein n=1 Tax=Haloferula chungangensis TaxID=1048331 RepID=A0ABW2L7J0_9BACT